jgi:O-acetyl-ADP-ribose deacetylase (regulator of RNase III)
VAVPLNVFISYRNTVLGGVIAQQLFDGLRNKGVHPYWDKDFLQAGDEWDETIYQSILESDVLIVVLTNEVIESDWVQREVDTARAAQIQILPYMVEARQPDLILKKLDLDNRQYWSHATPPDFDKLIRRLTSLMEKTREAQEKRVQSLQDRWRNSQPIKEPAKNATSIARFKLRDNTHSTTIHIASGRIQEIKNVDVIVNSENDYLQMSRFHETFTVSYWLRHCGAFINNVNGDLLEDTIQWELDAHINEFIKSRPVAQGYVIATTSGHPRSKLRNQNKSRFIFHAVTVAVFQKFRNKKMIPIETGEGIRECVINTLNHVAEVNAKNGVISPASLIMNGRSPYDEQMGSSASYEPIRGIVFPFFGAGHGGRLVEEVIPHMLEGINDFLQDNHDTSLTDIYLCAYFKHEVDLVKKAMSDIFEPVI